MIPHFPAISAPGAAKQDDIHIGELRARFSNESARYLDVDCAWKHFRHWQAQRLRQRMPVDAQSAVPAGEAARAFGSVEEDVEFYRIDMNDDPFGHGFSTDGETVNEGGIWAEMVERERAVEAVTDMIRGQRAAEAVAVS